MMPTLPPGCRRDLPVFVCVGRSIDEPIARKKIEPFEFKRRELRQIVSVGEIFSCGLEDRSRIAMRWRALQSAQPEVWRTRRMNRAGFYKSTRLSRSAPATPSESSVALEALKISFVRVGDYRLNAETRDVGLQLIASLGQINPTVKIVVHWHSIELERRESPVHPPAIRKYMSLCNCQYMLLPRFPQGSGKMISRGSSSLAYVRSVKKAGISSGLTQNDACGFGAIDARG